MTNPQARTGQDLANAARTAESRSGDKGKAPATDTAPATDKDKAPATDTAPAADSLVFESVDATDYNEDGTLKGSRKVERNNPFDAKMVEARAAGKDFAVVVPEAEVDERKQQLRSAAQYNGHSVRIRPRTLTDDSGKSTGKVKLNVQPKDKKTRSGDKS